VEFLPTIAAGSDEDVSKLAERIFKKQGMTIHTGTKVTGCEAGKESVVITAERKGKEISYEADKVLLSVGRKPNTEGLGLEAIGLKTDDKGRIPVDGFRTSVKGVWAIGDVIEGPMLAHKAEEDGVLVAEAIAGRKPHSDYSRVPNVIYTDPEIASVGLTERQAKEAGLEFKVGKFQLLANGRAIAQAATDGMAKVIADAHTDRILGAAIIASGASEMIASVVAHMEYGGSAEDLAATVHAHPTISESIKEAALAVDGRAIHSL
jgi:dihydrolipoamide dehydrogenase